MSNVKELNDTNLESTLQGSQHPVLLDFSATWCAPCKALAPTIDAVASEYDGRLDVYQIDIDSAPQAANHFGISSVPTVIFFKCGKEVDRFIGNADLRSVKEKVDKVLAG